MELIFQESIRIASEVSDKKNKSKNKDNDNQEGKPNNKPAIEKDVIADTTVQEKNITYPTDDKLYKKIIKKCVKIAEKEEIELRQNYKRTIQKLSYQQRFKKSKKQRHLSRKADRRIKTIAGRLVRELLRKLTPSQLEKHLQEIELYNRVLHQKREDKNKVYSLHEPHTECISKGKVHKKYEFGNKVSIIIGKETGIVLGALSLEKNDYDGHTLPGALKQFKEINGYEPKRAIVDLGYKGIDKIGETEVIRPDNGKGKSIYIRKKMKLNHRKRAGIEAKISHLKNDYRMNKNFYKGIIGDKVNVFLAAASLNFKIWMNDYKRRVKYFWLKLIIVIKLISNPILLAQSRFRTD
jgi:IS5 family transposase